MAKRVLILGGSRFIGAWLTRRLLNAGHEVTLFNRGRAEPPFGLDAERIEGDIDELDERAAGLRARGFDVVVHMIITGVQRAWDLTRAFPETPTVFISSADVYRPYGRLIGIEAGEPEEGLQREDSPLRQRLFPYRQRPAALPADEPGWRAFWGQADYDKIPAEALFQRASGERGVILRLPFVYGLGDPQRRLAATLAQAHDAEILLGEVASQWRWSPGAVANVAEAIARVVERFGEVGGRVFNVADPGVTTESWTRAVLARAGSSAAIRIVPDAELPEAAGEDFRHHLELDASQLREALGDCQVVSQEQALDEAIAWDRGLP